MADQKSGKQAEPDVNAMSVEDRVRYRYMHGIGSIQDIARWDRLTVEEVLAWIGQSDMTIVTTQGDLIDQSEAGPGVQIEASKQHYVTYTSD